MWQAKRRGTSFRRKSRGQPVEQIATPGEIASFSVVVADAHAVTFQWKLNGIDIPGATGDSLLLTNINAANEGQYSVVATNSTGSVTSAPAALTLRRDPTVNTSTPPRLTVYSDSGGSVTAAPMKSSYSLGDSVTLTATPFTDSVFADWVGDLMLDGNPRTLTMDGDKVARARFAPTLRRLIAFSDAGGSVTVTPMKRDYNPGETVTLTAKPFAPSVFSGWTGDLSGSNNPTTLTMNGNKKVRARFASAVAAPMPQGLIALWRGETDASDLIGGHHGAFFAGTAVTSPAIAAPPNITALGKVGQAVNFDGTVHVRVPDSAALKPVQQMSIEAWVFPTGPLAAFEQTIIARGGSSLSFFNGTWKMGLRNRFPTYTSHNGHGLQSAVEIPLNDWSHLAITFDGLESLRLYVNGALVSRATGSPATFTLGPLKYDPAPVPVTIGADWKRTLEPDWESHVISSPFHGRIDEVALYNRALTADEILSIWNADFMGKDLSRPYFTSPAQLPDVALGAIYMQQLTAILGTAPISFSLSAGVLPPGMTLSSAGLVSGVPSASGTFGFTIRATDAAGAFTEQLCVLQVFASVTAPAGLVGWWRAENDAQDSAGTNHGVLRNGAGFAAGRVGQAFALDGTDDCIEVPDAPALRPVSVTLEAWVAFDVTSGRQVPFAKPRGTGPFAGASYELWLEGGSLSGAANDGALSAPFSPVPGRWHHLAYTFDDGAKQQVLYVDGIQVASGSANTSIAYDAQPLLLGRGQRGTPISFFHGRIDEAAIYNRALSGAEIASIFNAGAAGKRQQPP